MAVLSFVGGGVLMALAFVVTLVLVSRVVVGRVRVTVGPLLRDLSEGARDLRFIQERAAPAFRCACGSYFLFGEPFLHHVKRCLKAQQRLTSDMEDDPGAQAR